MSRQEILGLEPNVNKDIVCGLYAADHIIDVFPPEVVLALAENASRNGVKVLLDAEVIGIAQEGARQVVETTRAASGPISLLTRRVGGRIGSLTWGEAATGASSSRKPS